MLVCELIAAYLRHTKADQNARTYEGRKRTLTHFAKVHGDLPMELAKPFHLRLWVDDQPGWKSDWTKKGAISTIQRCFNWAAKLGMIDRNPFHGVTQRDGENGRAMTNAEFRAALRSSSAPFRRVLIFLRFTGCRPCELCMLRPEHIDGSHRVITLPRHKTGRYTRKPRIIILHPVAAKLLVYLRRTMIPNQEVLFINCRGTQWKRYSLCCRMKRLRKRIGLPADCKNYSLRHKFCTDAILNGVDIATVAVLAGHRSVKTTQRYVHIDGDVDYLTAATQKAMGAKKV